MLLLGQFYGTIWGRGSKEPWLLTDSQTRGETQGQGRRILRTQEDREKKPCRGTEERQGGQQGQGAAGWLRLLDSITHNGRILFGCGFIWLAWDLFRFLFYHDNALLTWVGQSQSFNTIVRIGIPECGCDPE